MLHRFSRLPVFLALVLTSLASDVARAQESAAAQLAQSLAPLINNQTLVVAHIDLTKVQPAESFDQLAELVKLSQHNRVAFASLSRPWTEIAKALVQAGARDLFVMLSINDLPSGELVTVVPIRAGVDPAAIEKLLTIAPQYGDVGATAHRLDDLLVFARPPELANVKKLSPVARPELAAALAAVEGSTAQIVLMPSAETRRVIEETMPTLPKEIGGTASRIFTQGAQWIVAGLDLPPQKLDARLVIQSASAEAAAALNAELPRLLQTLGQLPIVQSTVPNFAEFASELRPTVAGDRLTLQRSSVMALASLLTPPLEIGWLQTARARSMNNLKQIMLAMFNCIDASKTNGFPPRTLYSADGKPLLSWRVQLLPYLDQAALFKEFHLDEPWDSQHNRQLIERMPNAYHSPLSRTGAGRTTYVVPVVEKGVFAGRESLQFKEIVDGLSNTIALVDADDDHAVIWTKPDDIEIDLADPFRGLINPALHAFLCARADGSANVISEKTDKKVLGRLFMATDGELIGPLP